MSVLQRFGVVMAALALWGCGQGVSLPGFPACETLLTSFEPCGGDVTGRWQITETCQEPMPAADFIGICPDVTGTALYDTTMVMHFDGAFTVLQESATFRLEVDATFTPECVAEYSDDCTGLEAVLIDFYADQVQCVPQDEGCRCWLVSEDVFTQPQPYTYSVLDTTLIIGNLASPFCVRGSQMIVDFGEPGAPELARFVRL